MTTAAAGSEVLDRDRAEALRLTPVSRETLARLDALVALVQERQQTMNLVAASTLPHIWTRHVADSLQLLPLAPGAQTWIDLGSGGGFPGLVIACALADFSGVAIHLVESTQKKAGFLADAAHRLALPVTVHAIRIEQAAKELSIRPEAVTARALAPLPQLLAYAAPFMEGSALGLFHKGQNAEAELTEAGKSWRFRCQSVPSLTDSRGRILIVTDLHPRANRR